MNFLAHFVLAGEDDDLLMGNFIADFINGKDYLKFSIPIQKGVEMHRFIDLYTDKHEIFRQNKRLLKPYRHYSGVILDVFYDHFLANNWTKLFGVSYENFVIDTYRKLDKNSKILPTSAQNSLKSMIKYNWLYHYQFIDGIERVLEGMVKRTKYDSMMDQSIFELVQHYKEFNDSFLNFWEDIYNVTDKYRI